MCSRNNASNADPEDRSLPVAESPDVLRCCNIALHFQAERSRQHDSSTRYPQTKALMLFAQPGDLVKLLLRGWSLPVACDWQADPIVQPVTDESIISGNEHTGSPDGIHHARVLVGALSGARKIRNYQAEQPDASAWRLILFAAGR